MADNFVQRGIQNLITWAYSGKLLDEHEEAIIERQRKLAELQNYYNNRQRRPLKVSPGGKDYNVLTNLTGVIINRSVSMLVGPGVDFSIEDDAAQELIQEIYKANSGDIFEHKLAQFGSIYGTAFIKIIPDGIEYKGKLYPRLVPLNPYNMTIKTKADDIDEVIAYVNRWNDGDDAWREITEKRDGVWFIRLEMAGRQTHGNWEMQSEVQWAYPWPPIAHCQNLPAAGDVYGLSDIEGIIELQDKYNAGQSDINTILGNNAFPLRYVKGGRLPRRIVAGQEVVDITPSRILEFQSETAEMGVAEMESDLSSSRAFVSDIRRDIFDVTSTVDAETLRMNASQITNFGLKVMYKDELAKNATKQMLYGTLLTEVNQHLLELSGMAGVDAGEIIWGDPLPVNEREEAEVLQADINMGVLSKETAAMIRNYDYEKESERIAAERQASDTLGGDMLRNFLARGQ